MYFLNRETYMRKGGTMTYAQSWLLSWSLAGMASKISPNQRKIIAIPKGESEKWAASAAFGTFYLYKVKAIFCILQVPLWWRDFLTRGAMLLGITR